MSLSSSVNRKCNVDLLNIVVYNYLTSVNEKFAEEFLQEFFPDDVIDKSTEISLEDVVRSYYDKQICDIGDDNSESDPKDSVKHVKTKYTTLLHQTFEKYKSINVMNNLNDETETDSAPKSSLLATNLLKHVVYKYLKTISDELATEFLSEYPSLVVQNDGSKDLSLQKVVRKYLYDHRHCLKNSEEKSNFVSFKGKCLDLTDSNENSQSKPVVKMKFKSRPPMRLFSNDEDEILLEALQSLSSAEAVPSTKVRELMKLTNNRTRESIKERLKKLQRGTTKKEKKEFSLLEDKFIIDEALTAVAECSSLDATYLSKKVMYDIGKSFNRDMRSIRDRWSTIRTWLLQYYKKTLNLEIRPMLANALADNFESRESIDWKLMTTFKEFLGHTEDSLRTNFNNIIYYYKQRMKIDNVAASKLTLKQIANFASSGEYHPRKVSSRIENRQRDLIEYFEVNASMKNVRNFV